MRTTLEITEHQRAELMRMAAQRGEKGFSSVIREALGQYIQVQANRAGAIRAALGVKGVLTDEEANEMQRITQATRRNG